MARRLETATAQVESPVLDGAQNPLEQLQATLGPDMERVNGLIRARVGAKVVPKEGRIEPEIAQTAANAG